MGSLRAISGNRMAWTRLMATKPMETSHECNVSLHWFGCPQAHDCLLREARGWQDGGCGFVQYAALEQDKNRNRATCVVARKLVAYLMAVDKSGEPFKAPDKEYMHHGYCFECGRLSHTQTSARPPKADAANGCLVARTFSSTRRTELQRRLSKSARKPERKIIAWRTAVLACAAASDELSATHSRHRPRPRPPERFPPRELHHEFPEHPEQRWQTACSADRLLPIMDVPMFSPWFFYCLKRLDKLRTIT